MLFGMPDQALIIKQTTEVHIYLILLLANNNIYYYGYDIAASHALGMASCYVIRHVRWNNLP